MGKKIIGTFRMVDKVEMNNQLWACFLPRRDCWMTGSLRGIYCLLLVQLITTPTTILARHSGLLPFRITADNTIKHDNGFLHILRGGADTDVITTTTTAVPTSNENGVLKEDEDRVLALARQYAVKATRIRHNSQQPQQEEKDEGRKYQSLEIMQPILDGSLKDALNMAKSQARLLVVLIPSPKNNADDKMAMESFLSVETAKIAEKRPYKSKKKSTATSTQISPDGSFLLWTVPPGSTEASTAMKRIRGLQASSKNKPLLFVIYPATVMDSSATGIVTIPKIVAQHHCSPPPDPSKMAGWLNELRKRHVKEYIKLQKVLQEQQIQQERIQGYRGSIRDDLQQREREERERIAGMERQRIEEERISAIQKRREELRASLLSSDEDVVGGIPVALRFADGRNGKRIFAPTTSLSQIFNWVDGIYEMEREDIILTTLNGKQQFEWKDEEDEEELPTLETFGKMVAFRVTQKKKKETQHVDETSKTDEL
jgi:hypothetical protein